MTDATPYGGYDVLAKWATPSFDDRTREALTRRLHEPPERRFFTAPEFDLLTAIVDRLAPPIAGLAPQLVALWIDDRLHRNLGPGYRLESEPPLQESWRRGLAAVDRDARRRAGAPFVELAAGATDDVLRAIEKGDVDPSLWPGLDPVAFFTDTLSSMIAGLSYAHPAGWSDIGFGGPASPRGYVRLGFDARDPWEAKERR